MDPGHGEGDADSHGYGGNEKNMTLLIAKKLNTYIKKNSLSEVKMVYIITTDVFISLIPNPGSPTIIMQIFLSSFIAMLFL
ncbi:MAG: N-acetylmuramoyl-L-alanine amidase [Flavobacteriales bacterium AspAUS03]